MAYKLHRVKTKTTPMVIIDEDKGYIRMEGVCYLEDVLSFFKEINEWLESYLATDFTCLTFDCEMPYFNSSATKQLYNMFVLMDQYASADKKIVVNWIIESDDDLGIEHGEDFKEDMQNLEFNLVEK